MIDVEQARIPDLVDVLKAGLKLEVNYHTIIVCDVLQHVRGLV